MSIGWMRTHYDLGIPYKTFVISLRNRIGADLYTALGSIKESDPEAAASVAYNAVVKARPSLSGCIILAIELRSYRKDALVTVMHQSFSRVPPGGYPREEELCPIKGKIQRLELCPVCKGEFGFVSYLRTIDGTTYEVCSNECVSEIVDSPLVVFKE